MDDGTLRWLAIVDDRVAYALDYYPEEFARYRQELGPKIVGEYATRREAFRAAYRMMMAREAPRPSYDGPKLIG